MPDLRLGITEEEIEKALKAALPIQLHDSVPSLTQIVLRKIRGQVSADGIHDLVPSNDTLERALEALREKPIGVGNSVISFGSSSQIGDAHIGSAAGRDVVNITIDSHAAASTFLTKDAALAKRNRDTMLRKVKTFWIDGVLQRSLYTDAILELGLEYDSRAVLHPWSLHYIDGDLLTRTEVPNGASILDIFNANSQELLILGQPGSGKTTTLLKLAQGLILAAQENEQLPIPVVFNLSSWSQQQLPIADWLIEEMSIRYDVPRKVGREWIESDRVLPLLDGLDEVSALHIDDCITAINLYRQDYGFSHLCVCSRTGEYETASQKLKLQTAVVIQPLSEIQIEEYFRNTKHVSERTRNALQNNNILQEVIRTPLMLNICALAFSVDKGQLSSFEANSVTEDDLKAKIFSQYIVVMLRRRPSRKYSDNEQVLRWLRWLARTMSLNNQSTFFLDWIQPNWLQGPLAKYIAPLFGTTIGAVITAILCSLSLGLSFGQAFDENVSRIFGYIGIFIGLVAGGVIAFRPDIGPVETLTWSWNSVRERFWISFQFAIIINVAMIVGGAFVFSQLYDVRTGVLVGVVFGVITLVITLLGAVAVTAPTANSIPVRTGSNEAIWRSARTAFVLGTSSGVIFGLIGAFMGWVGGDILTNLTGIDLFSSIGMSAAGITSALGSFMVLSLHFGARAFFQHIGIRLQLYFTGNAPIKYARFLDRCVELSFLRRIGGGYLFVHRLFLLHMASLTDEHLAYLAMKAQENKQSKSGSEK